MNDPRIEKLARVIVDYSVEVKKGDLVLLGGPPLAEPLIMELYRAVLRAGGHPWVRLIPSECSEVLLTEGSEEQLAYCGPLDKASIQKADAMIKIWSEDNTKALSNSDPKRQAIASKGRKPIMATMMKRSSLPASDPKFLRWTGTLFPTQAHAQDAHMSLRDYENFVYKGGKLDKRDPVKEWKKLGERQKHLADFLEKGKEMRITTPDGTDIRFGIAGRRWINCDGKNNFPDGEVFTGPIEDATEGVVQYRFPAVYGGREVNDIRLERRPVTYSYTDGDLYYFMDANTFDLFPIASDLLGPDQLKYLKENMECEGLVHDGNVISVELPQFVELEVTETDPGIRGDTAQGGSKPAKLETGATIQVPLFVEEGDVLKIDRTQDKYLSRVSA